MPNLGPAPEPRKSGSWIRLPSFGGGGGSVSMVEDPSPPPVPRSVKGKEKEVA
jgi:hypothetical protein